MTQNVETIRDLRHGLRTLLKRPAFFAVALLTLALGIGANTAMFSIINTVLLNGLPYSDSNRLVILDEKTDRTVAARFPGRIFWIGANRTGRLTTWQPTGFPM